MRPYLSVAAGHRENREGFMLTATTLLASAALATAPFPETFPVPTGSMPEGIASGKGTTLYVGSRADGSVYRADARTGRGAELVPGQAGRQAFGLKYADGKLFVAGGPTGSGFVYDARTGANVSAHDFDGTFVNDVTVTRKAAYFTDSQQARLYVLPRDGGAPFALPLGGEWEQVEGFNANGIAATPDGETLIVVQSVTGKLFAVDADTGVARLIDAPPVVNGDGILLAGPLLFVVQNQDNKIATLLLDRRLRRAIRIADLRDRDFDVPTTVARIGLRLYAINARFSSDPGPDTTHDVVKVG
jgi:DNA-binding beta-propeller fold protein YncE